MFGRLMSIPDDLMADYYLLLLGRELDEAGHPNEAKRELAREIVGTFHDEGAAVGAEGRFDAIHKRGEVPDEVPTVALPNGEDEEEVHLPALLASGFEISTSEARRLLGQGGVRLDGEVLAGDVLDLPGAELRGKVLQLGKRRFVRVA